MSISVISTLIIFLSFSASLVLSESHPNLNNFLHCLPLYVRASNPIAEAVFTRKNSSFDSVLGAYVKNKRFLTTKTPKPLAIVTARDESQVQATITCANLHSLQIRTRSGGHDYEGLSYVSSVPFVVLDMFNLRFISIDLGRKSAWVGAGATLGEIYSSIANASNKLAFPAGVCPTLGAGGHISGGGYGNLMRKYGLSVDNILDAKIIDVNGRVLNRAMMGEDFFWAIRGGGGASFGVILAWMIRLVSVPEIVTVFKVNRMVENGATDIVYKWQQVASKLPKELFIRAEPKIENQTVSVDFICEFLSSTDTLLRIMNIRFPELGLQREDCLEMSWINSTLFWADLPAGMPTSALLERPNAPASTYFKSKSDYVKHPISKEGLEKIWKAMTKMEGEWFMQWNPYGGAMEVIPEGATPFPHRAGNLFLIQYYSLWSQDGERVTSKYLKKMKDFYAIMAPYVSHSPREAFLNYRDIDIGSNPSNETSVREAMIYGSKYFKGNLKRLMAVKAKYDPNNFFKNEQSIPPAMLS